ncbi:hypothetical protein D3C87_1174710 [compost metagenome]
MTATVALKCRAAPRRLDQFNRGNGSHAEQHRVAVDLVQGTGNGTSLPVDGDGGNPLDAERIPGRLANHVPGQHLGAVLDQQTEQCRIAAHVSGLLNDCDNPHAFAGQRMGRRQRLCVAADQHGALAIQRLVNGRKPMSRAGAHDAGAMPAIKGQAHVASAGRDDDLFEAQQPGVFLIGQTGNGALDPRRGGLLREQSPDGRAEPHVDPGVERFGNLRTRIEQGLQHAVAVGHRRAHSAAEMQRHLFAHGFEGDRIFIHQRNAQAMPGGGQCGGEPRGTGADDENIGFVADRRRLACHRGGIVIDVLFGHRTSPEK